MAALHDIDARDPERLIGSCSLSALQRLVLRMGGIARAAIAADTQNKEADHE